jgi:hypothetical protein
MGNTSDVGKKKHNAYESRLWKCDHGMVIIYRTGEIVEPK